MKHGGNRTGAGRPFSTVTTKQLRINVPEELYDYLLAEIKILVIRERLKNNL